MSPLRRVSSLGLVVWAVLGPTVLTGCAGTPPDKRILQYLNQDGFGKRYSGNASEENYVTIGDFVEFVDTYHAEIRGTEQVDIDGTIQVPQAGTVFVAGMTRNELESHLTQKLSGFFVETDVKVNIRTGGAKVYYVIGEVRQQGSQRFMGDTTVLDAVLEAQPTPYTANLGRIKVIRADPVDPLILSVNVADLWKHGDSTFNVQLQEYDIVYVPPTLMKQLGDFLAGLMVPVLTPVSGVIRAIFVIGRGGRFGRNNDNGLF